LRADSLREIRRSLFCQEILLGQILVRGEPIAYRERDFVAQPVAVGAFEDDPELGPRCVLGLAVEDGAKIDPHDVA
jgi:hypothetical protein